MKESERPKEMRGLCPYCEEELSLETSPFCQACRVELRYCLKCNIVVERKAKVCPQCGQPLE
jgi:RNA polymerase subunit RPABC4/transcription elongation factor Spt4